MIPYIIAEIGSNWRKYESHEKNWSVSENQVRGAKECGADAVKFQLFTAQDLYGPKVKGTGFEKDFNRFALPPSWVAQLANLCQHVEIDFMCTAFSIAGYRFVDPYVKRHKLASSEATHPLLVEWLLNQPKPVLLSDGCGERVPPRYKDIDMRCVSNYPASFLDYELDYGFPINKAYDWGVSDHTLDENLALWALRFGAKYFEKHVDFCSYEGAKTPDSEVSIDRERFGEYVKAIRSFDPENINMLKANLRGKYARKLTDDGWYRPML